MLDAQWLKDKLRLTGYRNAVFIESTAGSVNEAVLSALEVLCTRKSSVILVSATRPAESVYEQCLERGIDTGDVTVIDCITAEIGEERADSAETWYIGGVSNLNDVFHAVHAATQVALEDTFIVIDSVPTLLMYNTDRDVARFVLKTLNVTRKNALGLIAFSVEKHVDEDVRAEMIQLFDNVLHPDPDA